MTFFAGQNYSIQSDEDLMAHISHGNEKAFNELHARYYGRLYQFVLYKLGHNEALAKDLLQNLFLKVIETAESFERSKNFQGWVYTIARNMCKNEYRSKKVRDAYKARYLANHSPTTASKIGPETMDLKRFEAVMRTELSRLDDKYSDTFLLRHEQGLALKAIAEIMDCPVGTVKSRLFHCTKELARRLHNFDVRTKS